QLAASLVLAATSIAHRLPVACGACSALRLARRGPRLSLMGCQSPAALAAIAVGLVVARGPGSGPGPLDLVPLGSIVDIASPTLHAPLARLPAQRIDADGRAHVDFRAVMALALPLMANSAVQIVLNLTDMWFVGHISTAALAAVGAVQWAILAVVLVLGGAAMAVQTLAAHAHGARRYRRAAQAAWTALWRTVCVAPVFIALGAAGNAILTPFGLPSGIATLAQEFWFPRVAGAPFGVAAVAMIG